jgi:hypothetical protein
MGKVLTILMVLKHAGATVTAFVGYEYECVEGHRMMAASPDKTVKVGPSGYVKVNDMLRANPNGTAICKQACWHRYAAFTSMFLRGTCMVLTFTSDGRLNCRGCTLLYPKHLPPSQLLLACRSLSLARLAAHIADWHDMPDWVVIHSDA